MHLLKSLRYTPCHHTSGSFSMSRCRDLGSNGRHQVAVSHHHDAETESRNSSDCSAMSRCLIMRFLLRVQTGQSVSALVRGWALGEAQVDRRSEACALVQWITVEVLMIPRGVDTFHLASPTSEARVTIETGQWVTVDPPRITELSNHCASLAGWIEAAGQPYAVMASLTPVRVRAPSPS